MTEDEIQHEIIQISIGSGDVRWMLEKLNNQDLKAVIKLIKRIGKA